jgi:hypothetical protein
MVTLCVQTWKAARYFMETSLGILFCLMALIVVLWAATGVAGFVGGWDAAMPLLASTMIAVIASMVFLVGLPVSFAIMLISGYVAQKLVS